LPSLATGHEANLNRQALTGQPNRAVSGTSLSGPPRGFLTLSGVIFAWLKRFALAG
jgi:hypothetical protein